VPVSAAIFSASKIDIIANSTTDDYLSGNKGIKSDFYVSRETMRLNNLNVSRET